MSTKIEWCDDTLNVAVGCTRVSEGCRHCYAERVVHRQMQDAHRGLTIASPDKGPRWNGTVRLMPERLATPLRWRKPRRVFVGSLMDLFHPEIPYEYIAAVFGVFAATPHITYQVLTKRDPRPFFEWLVEQALKCNEPPREVCIQHAYDRLHGPISHPILNDKGRAWPLDNVWIGVSAEDQRRANERIPWLLDTPAAVRFVSAEPLLGPIDFFRIASTGRDTDHNHIAYTDALHGHSYDGAYNHWDESAVRYHPRIDQVIAGSESGPKARPAQEDWYRLIRDQCRAAGVAFFLKQFSDGGKKRSLPVLDGEQRMEMPEVRDVRRHEADDG